MPQTAETKHKSGTQAARAPFLTESSAFRLTESRNSEHAEPAVDELLIEVAGRPRASRKTGGRSLRANVRQYAARARGRFTEKLDYAMEIVGHLESVATTRTPGNCELSAGNYNAVQPPVSELSLVAARTRKAPLAGCWIRASRSTRIFGSRSNSSATPAPPRPSNSPRVLGSRAAVSHQNARPVSAKRR